MISNFHQIIKNKSFYKIGSSRVIMRKNFVNQLIRSDNLRGLAFAHLAFVKSNFIAREYRHTSIVDCYFINCNFTETIFFKSELEDCNFKICKLF